jgi:Putative zinc finger in N-recognin (UBR box)
MMNLKDLQTEVTKITTEGLKGSFAAYLKNPGSDQEYNYIEDTNKLLQAERVLSFVNETNYCSNPVKPKNFSLTTRCTTELKAQEHIGYQCLDCAVASQDGRCNSLICSECFKNSLDENGKNIHANHRVIKVDFGGFCDCGDPTMWNPDCNCDSHKSEQTKAEITHNQESHASPNHPDFPYMSSRCYYLEYVFAPLVAPLFDGLRAWMDNSSNLPEWALVDDAPEHQSILEIIRGFCSLALIKILENFKIFLPRFYGKQSDDESDLSQSEVLTPNEIYKEHFFQSFLLGMIKNFSVSKPSLINPDSEISDKPKTSLLALFLKYHMAIMKLQDPKQHESLELSKIDDEEIIKILQPVFIAGLGLSEFKINFSKEYLNNLDSFYAFREDMKANYRHHVFFGLSPLYKLFCQLYTSTPKTVETKHNPSMTYLVVFEEDQETKFTSEFIRAISLTATIAKRNKQIESVLLERYKLYNPDPETHQDKAKSSKIKLEEYLKPADLNRGFCQPLLIFWKEFICSDPDVLYKFMSTEFTVDALVSIMEGCQEICQTYPARIHVAERAEIAKYSSLKLKCIANMLFAFQEIYQAMMRCAIMNESQRQDCCDTVLKVLGKRLLNRYKHLSRLPELSNPSQDTFVLDINLERLLAITACFKYACSKLSDQMTYKTVQIKGSEMPSDANHMKDLNHIMFCQNNDDADIVWSNLIYHSSSCLSFIKNIFDKVFPLVS